MESYQITETERQVISEASWKSMKKSVGTLSGRPLFSFIAICVGSNEELEAKKLEDLVHYVSETKKHDFEILLAPHDQESLDAWREKNKKLLEDMPGIESKMVNTLELRRGDDWKEDRQRFMHYLNNASNKDELHSLIEDGKNYYLSRKLRQGVYSEEQLKSSEMQEMGREHVIDDVVDIINRMRHHPGTSFVLFYNNTLTTLAQYYKEHAQNDKNLNPSNSVFSHFRFKLKAPEKADLRRKSDPGQSADSQSSSPSSEELLSNHESGKTANLNQGKQVVYVIPMPMPMYGQEQQNSGYILQSTGSARQPISILPQVNALVSNSSFPAQEQALSEVLPEENLRLVVQEKQLTPSTPPKQQSPERQESTVSSEEPQDLPRRAISDIYRAGASPEYLAKLIVNLNKTLPDSTLESSKIHIPEQQAANSQNNNSDRPRNTLPSPSINKTSNKPVTQASQNNGNDGSYVLGSANQPIRKVYRRPMLQQQPVPNCRSQAAQYNGPNHTLFGDRFGANNSRTPNALVNSHDPKRGYKNGGCNK